MGFNDVRRRVIKCLDTQAFESEAREAISENNLLATGQVTVEDVKRLISRCNGGQYTAKPMTEDPSIMKHEMKPVMAGEQWFIRFYFVELPADVAMFISVHKSKFPRT